MLEILGHVFRALDSPTNREQNLQKPQNVNRSLTGNLPETSETLANGHVASTLADLPLILRPIKAD